MLAISGAQAYVPNRSKTGFKANINELVEQVRGTAPPQEVTARLQEFQNVGEPSDNLYVNTFNTPHGAGNESTISILMMKSPGVDAQKIKKIIETPPYEGYLENGEYDKTHEGYREILHKVILDTKPSEIKATSKSIHDPQEIEKQRNESFDETFPPKKA